MPLHQRQTRPDEPEEQLSRVWWGDAIPDRGAEQSDRRRMPRPRAKRWSDRGHLWRTACVAGDSWRARLHAGAPWQAGPATASDGRELWRDATSVWSADTARRLSPDAADQHTICSDAPRRRGSLWSATRRDAAATGIPTATAAG